MNGGGHGAGNSKGVLNWWGGGAGGGGGGGGGSVWDGQTERRRHWVPYKAGKAMTKIGSREERGNVRSKRLERREGALAGEANHRNWDREGWRMNFFLSRVAELQERHAREGRGVEKGGTAGRSYEQSTYGRTIEVQSNF